MVELQVLHALDNIRQYTDHFLFCLPFLSVCFMPKIVFIVAVEFGNQKTKHN